MKNSYLSLLLLCLASPLLGQSKVVQGEALYPAFLWSLKASKIAQVDSAIHVEYDIYTVAEMLGGWNFVEYVRTIQEVRGPALVTKKTVRFVGFVEEEPTLDDQLPPGGYDPGLGSGWVVTEAMGLAYVAFYPWIWHPGLDWLYTLDGPVAKAKREAVTFADPPEGSLGWSPTLVDKAHLPEYPAFPPADIDSYAHEGQSYYLWSPEHGWLLKADLSHWFWSYKENDWLDLLNLMD